MAKAPKQIEFAYRDKRYKAKKTDNLPQRWLISHADDDYGYFGVLFGSNPTEAEFRGFIQGYLQGCEDGRAKLQEEFRELMGVKKDN